MLAKNKEYVHRRWMNWTFVVMIALAALIMLGVHGCPVPWPGPPQQLFPPDGIVFENYPRTTTLVWTPVRKAVAYRVEVDCYHCCVENQWCTDVGEVYIVEEVNRTTYTFDFVGAQPGRWRVSAINVHGEEGPRSAWSYFEYTI